MLCFTLVHISPWSESMTTLKLKNYLATLEFAATSSIEGLDGVIKL